MKVGLISDTHGRLHAGVLDHFDGVDRIIHAGDIGPYEIVVELEALAPVTAVYGNTDGFDVRERVPGVVSEELVGHTVTVLHGHQLGTPEPPGLRAAAPDADIIVFGHTHRPLVDPGDEETGLVVNPGSAGAPRFGMEPSVAILRLDDDPAVELIDL